MTVFDIHIFMQQPILDRIDLRIIQALAKDCRVSYRNIGSVVGLTTKSVRARVVKMVSSGVIEKFFVYINPAVLGYGTECILKMRYNETTENIIDRLNLLGDLFLHVRQIGGTSVFSLVVKTGAEDKIPLLIDSLKPAVMQSMFVSRPYVQKGPKQLDFRIIKCLLPNPRMHISEIASKLSISAKTVSRRLDIMKDNNVVQFSVLVNPASTRGYIQFVIVISVKETLNQYVLECIYRELSGNLLLQAPITSPDNLIVLIMFSQDIFTVDSILRKVESFDGVKTAELDILTGITLSQDWMVNEIERRLKNIEQINLKNQLKNKKKIVI
jgi:DNA-binding Lrp family transcriptional regulator